MTCSLRWYELTLLIRTSTAPSLTTSPRRVRGVSWARIGGALGMTRQSAWERFSAEQ